jgi:hypothetical protein
VLKTLIDIWLRVSVTFRSILMSSYWSEKGGVTYLSRYCVQWTFRFIWWRSVLQSESSYIYIYRPTALYCTTTSLDLEASVRCSSHHKNTALYQQLSSRLINAHDGNVSALGPAEMTGVRFPAMAVIPLSRTVLGPILPHIQSIPTAFISWGVKTTRARSWPLTLSNQ